MSLLPGAVYPVTLHKQTLFLQEDGDQRESKSGLLSSLWKANSKKAEPQRDENKDNNRPASGKSEASSSGPSPKG